MKKKTLEQPVTKFTLVILVGEVVNFFNLFGKPLRVPSGPEAHTHM